MEKSEEKPWGSAEIVEVVAYSAELKIPPKFDEDIYSRFIHKKIIDFKGSNVQIQTMNAKFLRLPGDKGSTSAVPNPAKLPHSPVTITMTSHNREELVKVLEYANEILDRCYLQGRVKTAKVEMSQDAYAALERICKAYKLEKSCDVHHSGKSCNSVQLTVLSGAPQGGAECLEGLLARIKSYVKPSGKRGATEASGAN